MLIFAFLELVAQQPAVPALLALPAVEPGYCLLQVHQILVCFLELQLGLLLQPGHGFGQFLDAELGLPLLLGRKLLPVGGVGQLALQTGLLAEEDAQLGLKLLDLQSD